MKQKLIIQSLSCKKASINAQIIILLTVNLHEPKNDKPLPLV
jgi:hypothetical protein